jgi:pimeloyl-ACP methyl ester carboxylesterase
MPQWLKEEIIEIRPGRQIFYRQVLLQQQQQQSQKDHETSICHLVFVHGTCASSAQFNSLLQALEELLQIPPYYDHDDDHDDHEKEDGKDYVMVGEASKTTVGNIQCHLYDAISCGNSPLVRDWDAYRTEEAIQDLHAILEQKLIGAATGGRSAIPIVLVGHSYAPTILIRYMDSIVGKSTTTNVVLSSSIKGCIFLSSAMSGNFNPIPNGGHFIFALPVMILQCLQPLLNQWFLQMAYHPKTNKRVIEEAKASNSRNYMFMAKAYHVHQQWATKEECVALQERIPVLGIHGREDKVLPLEAGMCLADAVKAKEFIVVEEASHQIMQEKPNDVAKHILKFISNLNLI